MLLVSDANKSSQNPKGVVVDQLLHDFYFILEQTTDLCVFRYQKAHKPIVDQETIQGHSVRAMYLLTAVADLVRLEPTKQQPLQTAVERFWNNMFDKKMYLTGGIGAIKQWEGFGIDYFLPSGTDEGGCYAETCAAIGVMMLAERVLQVSLHLIKMITY